MKVGSYGTGGRTYTSYRTQKPGSDVSCMRNTCSCLFIGVLFFWAWTEYDANRTVEAISSLASTAVSLPSGQDGVEALLNGGIAEGRLVHLSGIAAQAAEATVDEDFEFRFENAATVRRQTEYCQWKEIRHTSSRKVGQDANGRDIMEDQVSFSYVLGWQSYPVNSLFFDNPVAYHNPQRNPFPSYEAKSRALLGLNGELEVDAGLLRVEEPRPFRIPSNAGIAHNAFTHGFDRHDGKYIYSPYGESPLASVIGKAAASYFIDGVIDTGIGGICTPGDLRVSFSVADYPPTISVVAKLEGHKLVLATAENGRTLLLSAAGTKSVAEVADQHVADSDAHVTRVRIGTVLMGLVWMLILLFCRQKVEERLKSS